jgi:hypothetical protein
MEQGIVMLAQKVGLDTSDMAGKSMAGKLKDCEVKIREIMQEGGSSKRSGSSMGALGAANIRVNVPEKDTKRGSIYNKRM